MGRQTSVANRSRRSSAYGAGYQGYEALKKQYDADKGGYNVPKKTGRTGRSGTTFVASKYTPEQGGYYNDAPVRGSGPKARTTGGEYYDPNKAKTITDWAKQDKINTSRAKPFQRVHPSVTSARRGRKRVAAASAGRGGTILTDRLGGASEDERTRKRTLLGR